MMMIPIGGDGSSSSMKKKTKKRRRRNSRFSTTRKTRSSKTPSSYRRRRKRREELDEERAQRSVIGLLKRGLSLLRRSNVLFESAKRSPSFFTTIKYKRYVCIPRKTLCRLYTTIVVEYENSSPCRRRARLVESLTFELNTKDDDSSKEDVSAFTTVVVVIECEDSFPPRRRRRRTRRESENGRPEWSKCSRR